MANEQNVQINTFSRGMNMDIDPNFMPEGMYKYAENIRILANDSGTGGCLQNIERIKEYKISSQVTDEEDDFKNQIILGTVSIDSKQYSNERRSFTNTNVTVVLTKRIKNDKTYNILWKVYGFESETLIAKPILKGYLNINKEVQLVSNYESEKIINVYICDGENTIKIINITNEFKDEINDPQFFDINPGCVLQPMQLTEMVSGSLPAGMVQYCYQLFKKNGVETPTSPLSSKIPITNSSNSSKTTNGYNKDEISNKGCKLKATAFNDGRFDKLRVIRIDYLSNTSTPKIYIISETDILNNESGMFTFEYVDSGSGYLSELTQEEFNNLVPYEFIPQSITNMQNRLFAANIKEKTWDIEYDARAYRANYNGTVMLQSSTGDYIQASMDNILSGNTVIPEDHDCINPMNKTLLYPVEKSVDEYAWVTTSEQKYRGGKGLNVSYKFVTIDLIESEDSFESGHGGLFLKYNAELNVKARPLSSIKLHNPELSDYSKTIDIKKSSKIRNYSDPYFAANFLSYQRDEVYRFGIIFYNSKGIPTPVHWIGDVRFPALDVEGYQTFDYNKGIDGNADNPYELISHPLGIEFEVNNVPEEVKYYEIVRCDRTESDRSVVTQGLLNRTCKFNGWHPDGGDNIDYTISNGLLDRRPFLHPNFSSSCQYGWRDTRLGYYNAVNGTIGMPSDSDGLFDFVSADTAFNKTQLIVESNMEIVPLYCSSSKTNSYATNYDGLPGGGFDKTNGYVLGAIGMNVKNPTPSDNYNNCNTFGSIWMNTTAKYYGMTFILDRLDIQNYEDLYGPQGGVLKYYMFFDKSYANDKKVNTRSQYTIEDSAIATNVQQNVTSWIGDLKGTNIDYVGDKQFVNIAVGSQETWGPGGVKTIIYSPAVYNNDIKYTGITDTPFDYSRLIPGTTDRATVKYNMGSALTVNIKSNRSQYGGDTYNFRQGSVYTNIVTHLNQDGVNICFGGDTYLGVLDYSNCLIYSTNVGSKSAVYVGAYVPLESSVNVYYRNDKHFSQSTSGNNGNISANVGYMTDPGQVGDQSIQLKPMYTYNAAYSNTVGSKKYIPKSLYYEDDVETINRITCSEAKTAGEITNSWSLFKFANYIDVDEKYGPITNLKVLNNKLYYFQDNAVGIASVNDRSLITDNNSSKLVLGTGDILSRYDYVVLNNGSSIINDKSIINSKNTLYWYDIDKNEICSLGNDFQVLSKSRGVQSYLNSIGMRNKQNVVSLYDHKYNEVWFRIKDKSLVYNEKLDAFTSLYTHSPEYVSMFSNYLVTIKNNNFFYLHNVYDITSENKEEMISKVEFVVNKDAGFTKVFDNVSFDADFINNQNEVPQVIKEITFKTKTQQTEPITANDIENREDNYRFAIPREKQQDDADIYINKSYAGRMRGKYLICDYIFDCNNGREMKIPFIKTTYRYSAL